MTGFSEGMPIEGAPASRAAMGSGGAVLGGSTTEHAESLVLYDVAEGVCTLTLNRPERRNAWTHEMEHEYFARLDQAAADSSVRAIVLTGAGRSFCPGLDAQRLEGVVASAGLQLAGRRSQHYAMTIPKPMVAAINGPCAGIGLIQALMCDVRFMARGARLSTAYAKLGVPAEYGLSWLLPRLIGIEWTLDLLLSGRPVDGEEAKAIGLVSRVTDDDSVLDQAQTYARGLARGSSPRAMAAMRRQVWGDLGRGYTEANEIWLATMQRLNRPEANPDFAEGVAALVEKRPAMFSDLPLDEPLPPLPPFAPQ